MSCSTAVLVILVVLIALLTPAVETGLWGRGRFGAVGGWMGYGHVHWCVCTDMFVHVYIQHVYTCVHLCMIV